MSLPSYIDSKVQASLHYMKLRKRQRQKRQRYTERQGEEEGREERDPNPPSSLHPSQPFSTSYLGQGAF